MARIPTNEPERLHSNAQRLLEPLAVLNPYARRLTFIDTRTRTRRDHQKYLTLIEAVTLLRQRQKPRRRPMRCNAIPWPQVPTCAPKRQITNRSAGAASHGRSCGPTAAGKRQRLKGRRASLFRRLAPAATSVPGETKLTK